MISPLLSRPNRLTGRLETLHTDLIDLAYTLEREGRADAADIAIATAGHIREILDDELIASRLPADGANRGPSGMRRPAR